ncbi:hypothetical protein G5714_002704 [Onychostoma macrolepis]|uniref:Immunoglobulin subtype domain-containing protein n=1 Tax=Onychostoma macrolepis TaxID=369639 RepID=A0A7J6D871_9TELE|nr:hypothetical protein G5714_002704 [Onychostoma macrolepis]
MAAPLLLSLLLFICTFKTGFSAEIPVFVETGASVQLDIQTQELLKDKILYWEKDKSKKIFYRNKVDFNHSTLSLTLKNVEKTDSGLYTARANIKDGYVVEYKVSVIDAVKAPVLIRNSNSNDSCTVNFTCIAHNLTLTSSYNSGNCSTKKATSEEKYSLILYCSEEYIICNYSNPVSWKEGREEIKQLCVNIKENNSAHIHTKPYALIASTSVAVCVLVALLVFLSIFLHRKCKKGALEVDSTVYAQVETREIQKTDSDSHTYDVLDQVEAQTHKKTEDNPSMTTYSTVGQYPKPAIPP